MHNNIRVSERNLNYLKNPFLLISILLIVLGVVFFSAWFTVARFAKYSDLITALETTTATFGTLLGIITAGLMFTQGKFSELASELTQKSPDYLAHVLSLEKVQSIETHLLALRKTFTKLAAKTTITEEKSLYERTVNKASSMFVDFAVLLHLKLKQQGLTRAPDADFLVSEMDSNLYNAYQQRRQGVKKEWQILNIIRQVTETWEGSSAFSADKTDTTTSLKTDIKNSISLLKLKEHVEKGSKTNHAEATKALNDLGNKIDEINSRLHEDKIPQLLHQMKQASVISGKYFYLALVFIATPLLANLLILPFFSEATATLFQPIISFTSLLNIMGVIFLLLYINKILNV